MEQKKCVHWWLLCLSVLTRILLKLIAKPLKIIGSLFEHLLNGYIQRNSKHYYSFVGHLDTRLDLDKDIKHGDGKYYPALSMMASKLAYENKAVIRTTVSQHWKMKFIGFYNFYNVLQRKSTTQAFIFCDEKADGDTIVLAFRGTSPFVADDFDTDFDIASIKIDGMQGRIHKGFMIALGLKNYSLEDTDENENENENVYENDYLRDFSGSWPKNVDEQDPKPPLAYYTIKEKLKEIIANKPNTKIIVTGHSLGGALAILFPSILALHEEMQLLDRLKYIYTFGQPRVGDAEFGQFMKKSLREHNIKYYRIVYGYDLVPKLPLDDEITTFTHFGRSIHFNCLYKGKIVEEEIPNQGNRLLRLFKQPYKIIPQILLDCFASSLIAGLELIRGFTMEFIRGPDYKEGWLLICVRIIGMLIPSMVNHNPQDYVNSTRLASEDLFINFPGVP